MADVYERTGRAAEAAEANYKRAIALRPDYWDGYKALGGLLYDCQKRRPEAIAQFSACFRIHTDNPEAYSDLGVIYMEVNDSHSSAAAEAALQKSIQLAPNYQAYANLGWLYRGQQRLRSTLPKLPKKALELNDKDLARVGQPENRLHLWLKDTRENAFHVWAKALSLLEQ